MDKYDGTNKPNVTLSLNDTLVRHEPFYAPSVDAAAEIAEDETAAKEEGFETEFEAAGKRKGGSRIASFFIRGAVSALLLGALFLPKILPYKGSEKVTETAKTIIMSDITPNSKVGEGKIVEIIRKIMQKSSSEESEDEKGE